MFIPRALTDQLLKAARSFAAVIVTGPRRSGKTTLLRRVFPKASYHLLEDPDTVARLRADPRGAGAALRVRQRAAQDVGALQHQT
jgi:predicted AAA+ superfamily ATPase